MLGLLRIDPDLRWTPSQALQHPFITDAPIEGDWEAWLHRCPSATVPKSDKYEDPLASKLTSSESAPTGTPTETERSSSFHSSSSAEVIVASLRSPEPVEDKEAEVFHGGPEFERETAEVQKQSPPTEQKPPMKRRTTRRVPFVPPQDPLVTDPWSRRRRILLATKSGRRGSSLVVSGS